MPSEIDTDIPATFNDERSSSLPVVDEHEEFDVPQRFSVNDEATANWVVRRILSARAYATRVEQWAEHELKRAQREEAFFLGRYGAELEQWLRSRLTETRSRQRSINLPAGRVGLRKSTERLVVEDEPAALAWAREHCPQAVVETTVTRLRKSALSDHFSGTGELPDRGVRLEPSVDRLTIG